jgi:four helix bundle protein
LNLLVRDFLLNEEEDMRNYTELNVWKKAHHLTVEVYRQTKSFPKDEMFGLTSQMRRCSASIGANLAEGCGRQSDAELGRFVLIAMGSASELDYHLLLSRDLALLTEEQHCQLQSELVQIRKMLKSLHQAIKSSSAKS